MTYTPEQARAMLNELELGGREEAANRWLEICDYLRAHADALEELARMKAPVDGEIAEVVRKLRDWKQVRTKPMPLAHYFAAGCEAADILESLAAKVAELETELLGVKEYREKNPLGGPAKVFDAMADQIRAGDDFNKVIADYGWCPVERAERAEAALAESERKCERLKAESHNKRETSQTTCRISFPCP